MSVFKSSAICAAASGCLMLMGFSQVAGAAYVIGPDGFNVPPYANNANIVGQQGWLGTSADSGAGAQIINDGTGSGRGTSLFINNNAGASNVYRTIPAPSTEWHDVCRSADTARVFGGDCA